ncbi:MAG: hypothetical protein A3H45_09185 [Ignavibacteria bacterium RIFCSPLOWO2_02_FULL_55_14]|nr:MAG: hypothetical protein A3H45_09185 [Ignavibacteria bacterium RIFCSPLOWO2_02_FULL_55_14]
MSIEGGHALTMNVRDNSASASSVYFKLFKMKVPVFSTTVLRYSLNPQSELGRRVHVDLLFVDGSRLSEFQPLANDGASLQSPRGSMQAWSSVVCSVGIYAAGKAIQEILVGYDNAGDIGNVTAYLDSIEIVIAGDVPPPWTKTDVGAAEPAGNAAIEDGLWYVLGGGTGLQYTGDKFHFLSRPFTGNVCITAQLEGLEQVTGPSFAGVMIRESLLANSRSIMVGVYPQYGLQTSFRVTPTGPVTTITHDAGSKSAPRWLRAVRTGNVFSTFTSVDGEAWLDTLHTVTLAMDSTQSVGLAASSGSGSETIDTRFTSVSVTVTPATSVSEPVHQLPADFQLYQNYPNPFNPMTTLRYALPRASSVDIEIYNTMGQRVAVLVRAEQTAGEYRVQWNGINGSGTQAASGVYMCRMRIHSALNGRSELRVLGKKLLLLR